MNAPGAAESLKFRYWVLAGLESGIAGGVCVLLFGVMRSLAAGEAVWAAPVRIATAVFGRSILRDGAAAVFAGLSAIFFAAGAVGMVFGALMRWNWAFRRVVLLGPLAALASYYVLFELALDGPGVAGTRGWLVAAHVVFGLVLAMYPRFLHALRRAVGGTF
jgi:hypothetical protein